MRGKTAKFIEILSESNLRLALVQNRTNLKRGIQEPFFQFFAGIPKIDVFVKEFWNKNERRIKSWYKRMRRSDDCVVSASPRFLLEEICGRLGIKHLMATEVDTRTGRLLGKNCYGVEKIRRLFFEFENAHVDAFYSDSLSDLPLAQIAEQAYLVRKGVLITWNVAES